MGRESLSSSKQAASGGQAGGQAVGPPGWSGIGEIRNLRILFHSFRSVKIPRFVSPSGETAAAIPSLFPDARSDRGTGREERGGRGAEGLFIKDCLFWRVKKKEKKKKHSRALLFSKGGSRQRRIETVSHA